MRATVWAGRNSVEALSVPDPKIVNDRDAIVRATSTAICGSDLHLYEGYIPPVTIKTCLCHVRDICGPCRTGSATVTVIISHHLGLDQAPHGYEIFKHKQGGCTKVVLNP